MGDLIGMCSEQKGKRNRDCENRPLCSEGQECNGGGREKDSKLNDHWRGGKCRNRGEKKKMPRCFFIMISVSHSLFSPPLRGISTYEKWKQNKKDETNMLNSSAAVLSPFWC